MKHNLHLAVFQWAIILGLGSASQIKAAVYSVRDLGPLTDLAGRAESMPRALNHHGTVAGANVAGGSYRALVFSNSWTDLGTLGGSEAFAAAINHAGLVAGYSTTPGGLTRAFLWTPGGRDGSVGNPQMRDLGTLGGDSSQAYGINQSGQITGFAQTTKNERAFRYSNGVMTDIGGSLGGLPNSFGYAINSAGHVAGAAYNASYNVPHAFYYNGSTTVDLGTLGGSGAVALTINDWNEIAGYSVTADGFDHAFRYSGGVMRDLGTLGGNYSYANSINNSNVIVGGSFVDAADTIYHAFIIVSNTLVDLNTQVDSTGAGWVLTEARAINDVGQIAGVGWKQGGNRGFLLTPVLLVPPKIIGLNFIGSDLLVRFTSTATTTYSLEGTFNLPGGEWRVLVSGIEGTGGVVTTTHQGATSFPRHFYRVKVTSP
jgi:probable HAF family extracellular repeat protein